MPSDASEKDWRTFRELREVALDRFCKRVLHEVAADCADASRTHHERYRQVFKLLQDRDEQLARAFDDPRRSQLIVQLVVIHSLDLLEPEELARLSSDLLDRTATIARVIAE